MEPPPGPPPALPEEIVEEILVRFPPEDPASLVRAVLVCKPWCRLVSGAGFRRRFRQFHRTTPVLGFVCQLKEGDRRFPPHDHVARFVPTSSFRPAQTDHRNWYVLDARHGRVLLRNVLDLGPARFVVWDPVTNQRREVPLTEVCTNTFLGSVLCASTSACDHLDCHRGDILVVLLNGHGELSLCIYSSKTDAWSQPTFSALQRPIDMSAVVLVGNTLYFRIDSINILKYDVATQETSVILQPPGSRMLITMEDGGLGVAKMNNEATMLSLWSMEVNTNGDIGWTQTRVIDIMKLLPANVMFNNSRCFGLELSMGVLLMGTNVGLFCFDLKSGRVRKLWKETYVRNIRLIVPYISFYTPVVSMG